MEWLYYIIHYVYVYVYYITINYNNLTTLLPIRIKANNSVGFSGSKHFQKPYYHAYYRRPDSTGNSSVLS